MSDNVRNLREGIDGLQAALRAWAFGGSRERPFVGQPWTWTGERGRAALPPMVYRDLGDHIVEALATFPFDGRPPDLDAVAQTILRHIEGPHDDE